MIIIDSSNRSICEYYFKGKLMANTNKILTGTIAGASLLGAGTGIASADVVTPNETPASSEVTTVAQKETPEQVQEHKTLDDKQATETQEKAEKLEAEREALPEKHENELNAFDKDAEKQIEKQEQVVPNKEAQNEKDIQNAEKQMDKNVADKQVELDNDPARSAQEQRDQAQTDKTKSDKSVNDVADKTVKGANDKHTTDDKATKADEQKSINDANAKQKTDDTKSQAEADKSINGAKSTQTNTDKATKAEETKKITDAQNKQKTDDVKSKSDQKTADDKAKSVKDNDATIKADKATKASKDKQISDIQKTIDYKNKNKPKQTQGMTAEELKQNKAVGEKLVMDKDGNLKATSARPQNTVFEKGNLPTKLHKTNLSAEQEKQNLSPLGYFPSKKDTSERVKGKLTAKQQAQLNAYATLLVNDYLVSNGHKAFGNSKQANEAMLKVLDWRNAKGLNFEHTGFGQSFEIQRDILQDSGLKYQLENLGASLIAQNQELLDDTKYPVTMLQLMVGVYNSVWTMMYADNQPSNNWGHRDAFIRNANEGNLMSAGANYFPGSDMFGEYVFEFGFFQINTKEEVRGEGDKTTHYKVVKQDLLGNPKDAVQEFIGDEYNTTKDEAKRDALKAESNALGKKIADRQATLDADYAKAIKANAEKANAEIAEHKATADKAIADAKATSAKKIAEAKTMADQAIKTATEKLANEKLAHKALAEKTIADAKTKAEQELADHKALAEKTIKEAEEKRTAGLEANKVVFDKAMSSAKDETEEERQARHAKALAEFTAEEQVKLDTLKNKLAKELADLKAKQVTDMENLRAKLDADREALVAKQAEEVKNFPDYIKAEMNKLADKHSKEVSDMEKRHAKELQKAEQDAKKKLENNKGAVKEKNGKVTTDKFTKNTDGSITLPNGSKATPKVDANGNVIENEYVTEDGTVVKTIKSAKDFLNIGSKEVETKGSKAESSEAQTRIERLHGGSEELPNTGSKTNVFATLAGLAGLVASAMFLNKRKNV